VLLSDRRLEGLQVADYDQRYQQGYMADFGDLYETCRLAAVRQTLRSRRLFPEEPTTVVDIACGRGRYSPIIKEAFPSCQIIGIDISPVALELAMKHSPEDHFIAAACESLPLADDAVDMIFSIETLEHVLDVSATIQEWGRILRPGGRILFTTPCANKFSLEWFMMYFTSGLQTTEDGIGRFRRDEPAHLRRLTSRHVREFFAEAGLRVIHARFRSHFFTTVAHDLLFLRFPRLAYRMASLDWRLLRRFPNGASMVIVGEKMVT
jgi:ubiquinone/menaquinone biosynthesis C-methylase UbiE